MLLNAAIGILSWMKYQDVQILLINYFEGHFLLFPVFLQTKR